MLPTSRVLTLALLLASTTGACDKGPSHKAKADPAVASASATATPTAAPPTTELSGTKFGAGVSLADAVPIATLLADAGAYKGKTIRVEGMITDVCPKRGCWFEMAGTEPGQKLRFKVTDGEMVFPLEAKGRYAIAQGEVAVQELTLEETQKHAEYQAKEYGKAYDPASITKPEVIVRIDGTGAVFRDKK